MYTPRFKEKYQNEVLPALKEQFGFKSVMRVPRITKICLNQGLGKFGIADKKLIDAGVNLIESKRCHVALAQRVKAQGVVHHLAYHINVILVAGEFPHKHNGERILSLSHVAAPPVYVHGRTVGVGILSKCGHLLINSGLQGILEYLNGSGIGLAGRSQDVTEEI